MLVLKRAVGEWVYLDVPACPAGCCPGRRVKVGLAHVGRGDARLAFEASADVTIMRQELVDPPHAADRPTLDPEGFGTPADEVARLAAAARARGFATFPCPRCAAWRVLRSGAACRCERCGWSQEL